MLEGLLGEWDVTGEQPKFQGFVIPYSHIKEITSAKATSSGCSGKKGEKNRGGEPCNGQK